MIRTIVTPDKPVISLEIPSEYIGKEIEVIAFSKEEGLGQTVECKCTTIYSEDLHNGQQIEGISTIKNPFN
jgi:hypothetical protein